MTDIHNKSENKVYTESAKLKTLIKIIKALNSNQEIKGILDLIVTSGGEVVNGEESSLFLVDESNNRLVFHSVSGKHKDMLTELTVPLGQGIVGAVAKSGEPLIIEDAQNDARFFSKVDAETQTITRNIICVPMKVGEKVIGAIEVINAIGKESFDKNDVELLASLADQAAVAITNRQLYIDVKEKVEELSALYEIGQATSAITSVEDFFTETLQKISAIVGTKKNFILIKEKENYEVVATIGIEKLELQSAVDLLDEINFLPSFNNLFSNKKNFFDKSFIAVPLISKENIIGIICVGDRVQDNPFTEFNLRLLTTIASQITDAYINLILMKEEEKKKRIEKELEVMTKLQQSILPKTFPKLGGIKISGFNLPALEVGGDFYDFFAFENGDFGIVMADVSGKGLPAALFMALTRSVVKTNALKIQNPEEVLKISNELIIKDSEAGMFVTLFYLICNPVNNTITYSNAGHNRQLIIRNRKKTCEFLTTKGKPLGVFNESFYSQQSMEYDPGDMLFLYTDGIIEAFNEDFEEFGEERLLNILIDNSSNSPQKLIEIVQSEIKKFIGDATQSDDITMLAIKMD